MGFTCPIQKGAVRGISPIGEDVLMTETTVYHIAHGMIAENWSSFDLLGLLQKEGNQMSTEANKALVRRWVEEVLNKGNLAAIEELFAPDFVDHTNPPDWPPGREGHKQIMTVFHTAFPDFHYGIEHEVAEGDMVMVRGTYHLTHKGEFFGIAPTGKQVTTTGMHLLRLAAGELVEHWCNNDDLGTMRQLGVVSYMLPERSCGMGTTFCRSVSDYRYIPR